MRYNVSVARYRVSVSVTFFCECSESVIIFVTNVPASVVIVALAVTTECGLLGVKAVVSSRETLCAPGIGRHEDRL